MGAAAAFGGPAVDASPTGSLIALAGASCFAAAILIQLLPAAAAVDDEADAASHDADGEGDDPAGHGGDGGVPLAPASVTS